MRRCSACANCYLDEEVVDWDEGEFALIEKCLEGCDMTAEEQCRYFEEAKQ